MKTLGLIRVEEMVSEEFKKELDEIKKRYARRKSVPENLYNPLNTDVIFRRQEFERTLIKILKDNYSFNLKNLKLLEIGCGVGSNLSKFIELGFEPKNIIGNELILERVISARKILPKEVNIIEGNALELSFPSKTFDIVFQSTVFSSILDINFRKTLAFKLWNFTKPNGGILWYDFIYNNPQNPNVRKVTLKEVKQLFPIGEIKYCRLTLAPPISRVVTKIHPNFYHLFNLFPFLRTHILCWIKKI